MKIPKAEFAAPYLNYADKYIITSNPERTKFTLWELTKGDDYNKIATAKTPIQLYKKIETSQP